MTLPSPPTIRGIVPVIQKIAFELRYDFGLTYLDRCGRTANHIMKEYPEWHLGDDPNPQNAPLVSLRDATRFSFNSKQMNVSLERRVDDEDKIGSDNVEDFAERAEQLADIVIDDLGLSEFPRIGFRIWFVFPQESMEQSEAWLAGLEQFQLSESLSTAFPAGIEATNFAVVFSPDETQRKFRIAFNGVTTKSERHVGGTRMAIDRKSLRGPQKEVVDTLKRARFTEGQFASMIDIDVSREPEPDPSPREYIADAYRDTIAKLGAFRRKSS